MLQILSHQQQLRNISDTGIRVRNSIDDAVLQKFRNKVTGLDVP